MDAKAVKRRLGDSIRLERNKLGMSQEELAFKCGLHRTYIGSVERGERNISIENIVKICEALSITAHGLLEKSEL